MRSIPVSPVLISLFPLLMNISCKKDMWCRKCVKPPIASAGPDQVISLPANAVKLDGSGSTGLDNNIISYLWTKIAGPASFNIESAYAVQTLVSNLVQGVYQFELKVADGGGLFSKDTIQVTVNIQTSFITCPPANRPIIYAQLIPFGNLSIARDRIATIAAGNELFFAGGYNAAGPSTRVDIYDLATNRWSTSELSIARHSIVTAVTGDKVLFAGGHYTNNYTTRVDIYNLTTQSWSIAELSEGRAEMAVAVIGNKVFFAGGFNGQYYLTGPSSRVDIYDASTNLWSTAALSEARGSIAAVATESKIYFAGGYDGNDSGSPSSKIDIYDVATDTWTTSALTIARTFFAGTYHDAKIYWAGGTTYVNTGAGESGTCSVEVRNSNGQIVDSAYLFGQNSPIKAFKKGNRILYLKGFGPYDNPAYFDIHDFSSNSWSIGFLDHSGLYHTRSILAAYDNVYVSGGFLDNGGAGGIYTSQVWRLDF